MPFAFGDRKLRKMKVDELMEGDFMDNISTEDEGNLVEGVISHNNDVHSKVGSLSYLSRQRLAAYIM
jgi:hypothetical protein